MRTVKTKTYKFNELSEDAKEMAIENMRDINVDYDWWEFTYEDAETIGFRINEFDLNRESYCKGEFLTNAKFCALRIIKLHGESCETHKTAKQFLQDREEILKKHEDEYEAEDELDVLESDFKYSLQEDYRIILEKEYEHQTSEKAIIETIECNDYEFTADGKLF